MMCPECQLGRLRPVLVPYMYQLGQHLLIAPDVPALSCDFCGGLEYNSDYMERLQHLIDAQTMESNRAVGLGRHHRSPAHDSWHRARKSQ